MSAGGSPGPQESPARPPRSAATDVLIVGAGPTGLMAGAWCAALGVKALVVDGKAGPTRESRALGLQSRSLEIYRQLGLDRAVLEGSTPVATVSPGFGHRTLGTLRLDRVGRGLTPFPGITVFEQSANEELLAGFLAQRRRPVAWGTSFHSFADPRRPDPADAGPGSPVTARLETPEGPVLVTARYVVAADGASSPVRRALGIAFEGSTNPFEFYVLDAHGVTGTEPGIMVRASREHFMLAFPLGDDGRGGRRVRLLGILRAEDRTADLAADAHDEARDEARARASLAEEFGIRYAGTDWYSTYRVHHRVAAAFRSGGAGRVFLAGDAAHIHSPVGAQGMNTGLQDAQNIVCKIADVLTGRDTAEVLKRYEAERRPVALNLVRTTDVVFGAVTSTSAGARLLRTLVLPAVAPLVLRLVPRSPAGGRLFGYLSQTRIHYWMPGTAGYTGAGAAESAGSRGRRHRGRVLGRRLPWVPDAGRSLPEDGAAPGVDNHEALTAAIWQVHAYGPAAVEPANALAERHREKAAGPGGPASGTGVGLPVLTFRAAPEVGLPDGTALLIRPDGFVADLAAPGTRHSGSRHPNNWRSIPARLLASNRSDRSGFDRQMREGVSPR